MFRVAGLRLVAGFAEQERPRIRIRGVLMPGKSSFQPSSKHGAEFWRQARQERRRVHRAQNGGRHQRVKTRAEAASVELRPPEANLFGDVGERKEGAHDAPPSSPRAA